MFEGYTVTVVGGEGSVAVPGKSEFGRPWGSEMGALGVYQRLGSLWGSQLGMSRGASDYGAFGS